MESLGDGVKLDLGQLFFVGDGGIEGIACYDPSVGVQVDAVGSFDACFDGGVAAQLGTSCKAGVLDCRARGNDAGNIVSEGEDVFTGCLDDGLIHGSLVGCKVLVENIFDAAGVKCPGDVPDEFNIRLKGADVRNQAGNVIFVGFGEGGFFGALLEEDDVPILVHNAVFHGGAVDNRPLAVLFFGVLVFVDVVFGKFYVGFKGAGAFINSCDGYIGKAFGKCDIIKIFGGIQAEAGGDGQKLQGLTVG